MSDPRPYSPWIELRPIADESFRARVWEAQVQDGHDKFKPQYALTKNGEIMGAFSIVRLPMEIVWMRRGFAKPVDTMRAAHEIMNLLRCQNEGCVIWQPANPVFEQLLPGLGYAPLTNYWGRVL